ncbi:MAG: sigma-54 dependent transcriptional regulator [bacterium]
MANVLIIDKNADYANLLCIKVAELGHKVSKSQTLSEGMQWFDSEEFDVVFINDRMPDGRGVDVLPRLLKRPQSPEVIIISDEADPNQAESAIKQGAWDYCERSASEQAIILPLIRALQYRSRKAPENQRTELKHETLQEIKGTSAHIKSVLELVQRASDSDVSVLVGGETGTGKELVAWAIHVNGPRSAGDFVVVDCAALPETLVESTLFGHVKGAFTGADRSQTGLIKQADGGTLFLDEIGELPLPVQKSFLRVLEEGSFRPVGGANEVKSDFRIIAASNRDLDELVRAGGFREDLLFRIRSLHIEVPPLRERPEDIEVLVEYYLAEICQRYSVDKKDYSPEFMSYLKDYEWPGNVRELINALERAIATAQFEPVLYPKHLPTYIRVQMARNSAIQKSEPQKNPLEPVQNPHNFPSLNQVRESALANVEKKYLQDLMSFTRGDVRKASQVSGLSRSRLYALLKKRGVGTK